MSITLKAIIPWPSWIQPWPDPLNPKAKHRQLIFALAALGLVSCAQNHPGNLSAESPAAAKTGKSGLGAARVLFLNNCAHCHGADARGDEGPDLHNLGETDEWVANRIRQGKAGQMTAFAGKLKPEEIHLLVAYVRNLH